MKKFLSIFLALMMLTSAAVLAVNADIIYEDDFEDEEFDLYDHATGEGFWFSNKETGQHGMGKFEETGGTLNGFDDAKFCFSAYWGDEDNGHSFAESYPMFNEMTGWIDVKIDESGISDTFACGLVFEDTYDNDRGYQEGSDAYYLAYYAIDGEHAEDPAEAPTSFVRLSYNTPRKDKNLERDLSTDSKKHEYVLGENFIEGDPYFNINGDPVKIGIRFGHGNITAYANGKIVASYDRETIGKAYTPAVWVQNIGCYVELDNYGLGTYDHNVKAMTRPADYALYEGKVTVMDGENVAGENVAGEIAAAEDDALKITAPAVEGRKFVKWESISIDGKTVTDFEKTALLYGITLGSLESEKYEMTMPDADVVLVAVYADDDTPGPGPGPGPDPDIIPGDANGDGKLNAKDVVAIMKHIVGSTPAKFVAEAADFDANGSINAKDVTKLMKQLVVEA